MKTANAFENAYINALELHALGNWYGLSVYTFGDIETARRFLSALREISGSGCTMIEPEQDTDTQGRPFYRVENKPTTAMGSALCSLLSRAYFCD